MRQRVAFGTGPGARPLGEGRARNRTRTDEESVCKRELQPTGVVRRVLRGAGCVSRAAGRPVLVADVAPSAISLCCIGACFRVMSEKSGIDARYGWLYPLGVSQWRAMVRSMFSAVVRRGVMWRGTFYPLRELKLHNSPWQWERTAARPGERKREGSGPCASGYWRSGPRCGDEVPETTMLNRRRSAKPRPPAARSASRHTRPGSPETPRRCGRP